MITIKIANIPIGIEHKYERMAAFACDYLAEDVPQFIVSISDEDIAAERARTDSDFPDDYIETIAVYRKIAEQLPRYDAFLFHGSVIDVGGDAYIITANSGVGKTTHTGLWLSEFPDAKILNGDKPIIRIIDGVAYAFGTPWCGKEGYGENGIALVRGFAFLERAEQNRAYPIKPEDAVVRFMSQIYRPKGEREMLSKTLLLANRVIKSAVLVHLECNMQPEAAHVCRKALCEDNKDV